MPADGKSTHPFVDRSYLSLDLLFSSDLRTRYTTGNGSGLRL
jgi:hypothetical protein